MNEAKSTYNKSLDDELDWKLIDQLHSAVSQISGFCFEAKKLCVTVEFVVITIIATFTDKRLDHSVFVAGTLIPLCFWFLDSIGYYYQTKLRVTMERIRSDLIERNSNSKKYGRSEPFIHRNRIGKNWKDRVKLASVNHSMWLYWILLAVNLFIWALFCARIIA